MRLCSKNIEFIHQKMIFWGVKSLFFKIFEEKD